MEQLINAPDRVSLVAQARALDRVLLYGYYVIPQWHLRTQRVLYWDKFSRPAVTPRSGTSIDYWWFDEAKAARLEQQKSEQTQSADQNTGGMPGKGITLGGLAIIGVRRFDFIPPRAAASKQSMTAYIVRRLLLMIPTLIGIMLINFIIVQAAPGGPVEQAIAQLTGQGSPITERITRTGTGETLTPSPSVDGSKSRYRGAQGLDPEFIKELEQRFGFDKPMHERFLKMMGNYLTFDFGESFFRDRQVLDLVLEKMPVSISLGVWTTLIVYLVSIPLGIRKAVRDGSRFDIATSFALVIGTAIPSFLFAVFLCW